MNLTGKQVRFPATDLYGITAEEFSRGRNNVQVVREMILAGIRVIQYREKDKQDLHKYEECLQIRELTRAAGVTFIINDDVDIALLAKADGVHLGQDDLPIEKVRELVPASMIVGVSTHSPDQARDARRRGADYIGVGPVFATTTKRDVCAPVGLEYVRFVAENIDLPWVAIGGIKEHNVHLVREAGATCVAMVTEIVAAPDLAGKVSAVRKILGSP